MRSAVRYAIMILCASCAVPFGPRSASSAAADCAGIDNDRQLFSALAKGAGVLAGAGGLTIIPVDDSAGRIGLAIGAAVAGAGAVVFQVLSDQKGASWSRQCAQ